MASPVPREMQEMMRKKKEQEREAARSKARMNSGRRRRLNLTIEQATDLTLLDREVHVHVLHNYTVSIRRM